MIKAIVTQYKNAKIIREGKLFHGDLWVSQGKITNPAPNADQIVDIKNQYLAPGYIDLQINGGFGVDFTTQLADLDITTKMLLKHGVTAFLPTLISSFPENYHSQLNAYNSRKKIHVEANSLGLHLEGPFLNPLRKGAHSEQYMRNFTEISINEMYGNLKSVRMITLAPEIPGAMQAIKRLKEEGIVVAIGHSEASEQVFLKAIEIGATVVTHLFNAMTPFHHRLPGIISETLSSKLFYSIISDGIHLNAIALQMAWKLNPEGLFLISDAVSLWGSNEVIGTQAHVNIEATGKSAYVPETGRLAGGLVGLDQNVRHFYAMTGCSVPEAIEAASTKPAKILGIESEKGTLNVGSDADMIVLDDKLEVQATYIAGEKVWSKEA